MERKRCRDWKDSDACVRVSHAASDEPIERFDELCVWIVKRVQKGAGIGYCEMG